MYKDIREAAKNFIDNYHYNSKTGNIDLKNKKNTNFDSRMLALSN